MVANTPSSLTPEKIEAILLDYSQLHLHIASLARKHDLSIDDLFDLVRDPEARKHLETLRALADDRTDLALDLALPMAIDRLVDLMTDENNPPEVRRKSASQIIRYHTQRKRERAEARERRPPPVPVSEPGLSRPEGRSHRAPACTAPPVGASASVPNPSPLGGEVADSPWRSRVRGRPQSPAAQLLDRAATPVRAP